MNGAFDGVKNFSEPIALWWVYHQFPSRHLQVFYNLSHAADAMDAAKAVEPLTSPGLNFMWADTSGNIAWWAAAKLPIRPAHVNPQIILDGSTGADDPTGWLDFTQNPQMLNPLKGVIYTANNQPDDMGTGLVPGYYVPSNRAQRIEELIVNERNDWTEDDIRKVINDIKVPSYASLLKSVLPVIDQTNLTPEAKRTYDVLARWDGTHGLDNIEPTIYYKFIYLIYKDVLEDELGAEAFRSFEHTLSLKRNTASLLKNDSSGWWDNISTASVKETRQEILTKAMNGTTSSLQKQLGNDMTGWQWKSAFH
jgi:penicillin amidase